MKKILPILFVCFLLTKFTFSQSSDTVSVRSPKAINLKDNSGSKGGSPFNTNLYSDGGIILGAVGINLLGYELIKNKKNLTFTELATKTKSSLPFFDRGNAGYYSPQADKDSYILFDGSYAIPLIVGLVNKKERAKFGQVVVLYLETMAVTGSMYTLTAGLLYTELKHHWKRDWIKELRDLSMEAM